MVDANRTTKKHEKRMYHLHWECYMRPKYRLYHWLRELFGIEFSNKPSIQAKVDNHRGQLVLFDWRVCRLIGWTTQYDEDYYYITLGDKAKITLMSCVGGFTPLHGGISKVNYYRLANVWNLNRPSYTEGLKMARDMGIVVS